MHMGFLLMILIKYKIVVCKAIATALAKLGLDFSLHGIFHCLIRDKGISLAIAIGKLD